MTGNRNINKEKVFFEFLDGLSKDKFHAGVIAALQVVALHDLESVWWEIVDTCDEKELREFAKRDEMLDLAGFNKYKSRQ